jgi:hypothetical protein
MLVYMNCYENGSIWEKCVCHIEFSLVEEDLEVVNVCLSWFNKDNSFESNRADSEERRPEMIKGTLIRNPLRNLF